MQQRSAFHVIRTEFIKEHHAIVMDVTERTMKGHKIRIIVKQVFRQIVNPVTKQVIQIGIPGSITTTYSHLLEDTRPLHVQPATRMEFTKEHLVIVSVVTEKIMIQHRILITDNQVSPRIAIPVTNQQIRVGVAATSITVVSSH